jgi:hypothetical protein
LESRNESLKIQSIFPGSIGQILTHLKINRQEDKYPKKEKKTIPELAQLILERLFETV